MKTAGGIALILLGLVLAFSGVQRATWNPAAGRHDFAWGLHDPVALTAGVLAFGAGIALLTGLLGRSRHAARRSY